MNYKFELHIQCSKDITKLNIDFADGTSVISTPEVPKASKENYLDTSDSEYDDIRNEIVEKPIINERTSETPKVAEEMQKLEI